VVILVRTHSAWDWLIGHRNSPRTPADGRHYAQFVVIDGHVRRSLITPSPQKACAGEGLVVHRRRGEVHARGADSE
jgi:hypothetical protein